jgi:hypothetical protein
MYRTAASAERFSIGSAVMPYASQMAIVAMAWA